MAHFARMRLQEELVAAATAQPGLMAEAAHGGIAMALYAAYERRKEVAVTHDDIIRKLVLVEEENARADQAEKQNERAYGLPHLRALVCLWRDHPNYDPSWATPAGDRVRPTMEHGVAQPDERPDIDRRREVGAATRRLGTTVAQRSAPLASSVLSTRVTSA